MRKFFVIMAVVLFTLACQNKQAQQTAENNDTSIVILPETKDNQTLTQCYLAIIGRDSVMFETEKNGNTVNGYLFYNRYHTDGSFGYFTGAVYGDTIRGQYRFLSEGMISYIDKAFLIKDNQLQEGIGALLNPNDSTFTFTNIKKVEFGKSYIFQKTDCKPEFILTKDKDFYKNYRLPH